MKIIERLSSGVKYMFDDNMKSYSQALMQGYTRNFMKRITCDFISDSSYLTELIHFWIQVGIWTI